jgi:hypothetical protein
MSRRLFALFFLLLIGIVRADQPVAFAATKLRFATAEEAGKFLAEEDEYFRALGPLHRSIFLKKKEPVSLDDLKKHVVTCGRDWTPAEREKFTRAFAEFAPAAEKLKLRLPAEVLLIKTNGDEDLGTPYTRRNGIIFPESAAEKMNGKMLAFVCAHELFHVLSRHNPAARDAIYGIFGFVPVKDPPKPARWAEDRITNPDAPESAHAFKATLADGDKLQAVPFLISRKTQYDEKRGKNLGTYLDVVWLEVPEQPDAKPRTFTLRDFTNFDESTGGNTGYTIHPEEISADNFAHLITGSPIVKTPAKLKELEAVLPTVAK